MTAVVFAVTAATSVLGLVVPAVLDALERTPDGLHGQWWRLVTALFVQDGGVLGTVSNLAFLALLGLLVVALLAGTRLPPLAPMAVLWWCGAVAAGVWGTGALLAGVAVAAATRPGWPPPPGRA